MSLEARADDPLSRDEYESVLEAAKTYREALVVRLCGEVGLRPAELPRLSPGSVDQVQSDPPRYLLRIPPPETARESGRSTADGDPDADEESTVDPEAPDRTGGRTAYLPTGVARELGRYALSNAVDDGEDLFTVTPRRLQMLVAEVTDRAAERSSTESLAAISSDDLRRYFARRALAEWEVNPRVVKTVGGWRSFESLEPYLPEPSDDEIVRAFGASERDRQPSQGDVEGGDGVVRSLFDATDRYALVRLDADGYVERWNRSAAAMFGYDAGEIVGTHVSTFYAEGNGAGPADSGTGPRYVDDDAIDRDVGPDRALQAAVDGEGLEVEGWRVRRNGSRFRAVEIVAPLREADGRLRGFSVLVSDVTDSYDRLEEVTAERREFERLHVVARRHRAVTRALLESSTHGEVETGTCEALVEGDAYAFAWIDRTILESSRREWQTTAGIEPAAVDRLVTTIEDGAAERSRDRGVGRPRDSQVSGSSAGSDGSDGDDAAGGTAGGSNGVSADMDPESATGAKSTADAGSATESESATVTEADGPDHPVTVERDVTVELASGSDFEGDVATVELAYGNTVYGTLSIAAARRGAFDDRERAWLATTGRQVGYAIAAMRRRTLLLSDTLVELDVRCRDDRAFFVDASARLGCRFELISLVGVSESTKLYYLHLEGAKPEAVVDIADDDPGIGDCRLIETREDGWRIEIAVSGSSPALTLTEYGATVAGAVFDDGTGAITAECAADADLRTIVGGLRSAFPDADLQGKREVERSVRTAREFRDGIEDRLTDKQESALRAAYFAGYYDWPRESTAEEVADAMDISSPTLHNHLRKGQHELLRTFFDGASVRDADRR